MSFCNIVIVDWKLIDLAIGFAFFVPKLSIPSYIATRS